MKQAKVRRKFELHTKEVDVNEAGELLETVVQIQEMGLVVQILKRILNKRNLKSNYSKKWFQKKKDDGMKLMQIQELKKKKRFVCKEENELTSCKT